MPPTPNQVRLIARAASEAGENAESLYYLSEYRLMIGDLVGGINYLQQALRLPELQEIQRIRFEARIDFIREFMTEEQLRRMQPTATVRQVCVAMHLVRYSLKLSCLLLCFRICVCPACTTVPPEQRAESDPWEPLNRPLYTVNMRFDKRDASRLQRLPKKLGPGPYPQRRFKLLSRI